MIAEGIFTKVEMPGNLPRAWVGRGFYAADFQQKSNLVGVIYAYYFDGSNLGDSVRLFDSMSGKEIGNFNPHLGGLKLE